MWIVREDYDKLEKAIKVAENHVEQLADEEKVVVEDAENVLKALEEKRLKDNIRCAAYIKRKRQENPAYAGGGYVRKADRNN